MRNTNHLLDEYRRVAQCRGGEHCDGMALRELVSNFGLNEVPGDVVAIAGVRSRDDCEPLARLRVRGHGGSSSRAHRGSVPISATKSPSRRKYEKA